MTAVCAAHPAKARCGTRALRAIPQIARAEIENQLFF
jgi:hypothetical protein